MKTLTGKLSWRKIFASILVVILAGALAACAGKQMSDLEKETVQMAMSNYIQEKTVRGGGTYLLDGERADFDYLHDGVKAKEDMFISCADFKIGSDVYDLDYYVKYIDGKPTVVKEVLHKKNGEKVNQVLWQK